MLLQRGGLVPVTNALCVCQDIHFYTIVCLPPNKQSAASLKACLLTCFLACLCFNALQISIGFFSTVFLPESACVYNRNFSNHLNCELQIFTLNLITSSSYELLAWKHVP